MSYDVRINDENSCQPGDPTKVEIVGNIILVTFSNGSIRQDELPGVDVSGFVTTDVFNNHKHTIADITDFNPADYATAAQGAKADSAAQPGDNLSIFNNDLGIPSAQQIQTLEDLINNHIANTSNPHGVTKEQVGLGSVDNTPDASKPVSTPQQTEINNKYNAAISYINTELSNKVTKVAGSRLITEIEGNKLAEFDEKHYRRPVESLTELTAIPPGSLYDDERRYVASEGKDYFYDAEAVSGDAAPDAQVGSTGFWKTSTGGSGGSYTQWRLSTAGTFRKNMVDGSTLDLRALGLIDVAYTPEGAVTYSTTATKNQPDSHLLDRANHTGEQPISSVTDLAITLEELILPVPSQQAYDDMVAAGEDKPGTLYLIPCE